MSDLDKSLDHLVARARQAEQNTELPLGLDTRVLAGLRAGRGASGSSLWAIFAPRAVPFAAAAFLLTLALQHFTAQPKPPIESELANALFEELLKP